MPLLCGMVYFTGIALKVVQRVGFYYCQALLPMAQRPLALLIARQRDVA